MNKENKADDYFRSFKEGFNELGQKVNRMVDDFLNKEGMSGEARIAADEYETADLYLIEMELPGLKKADVSLKVVDGVLNVKGEKVGGENEVIRTHRRERSYGSFMRSFPLPAYVELEKIKARFEEGVLTVRFQKSQTDQDDQTDINIE